MAGMDLGAQALLGQVSSGWFAPNVPIGPLAPAGQAIGRRFDYAQSVNLNVRPKSADGEGPTYDVLHRMVANCDILSIALYSMLERISKYEGRVLDVGGDPRKPSKQAQAIQDWMQFPDGSTPFATWMQTLGYDMAVTDNATVYIDRSGKVPLARIQDGQTIAIRVDERGEPKMVQQIIKGSPAHDYAMDAENAKPYGFDTMVWCPKHRRVNKVYGFSYVEQIRTTVTLALQRTARQLDYFTTGNVPAMLIEAPSNWTPGMVREANEEWRDILAGVSGKEEVQIMPNGMKPFVFERDVVKNDFDEWLVRMVCFQFSVPVTPMVKETNRATAEATQEASLKEGHAAQLRWASDSLTKVIRATYGPQFYWKWDTESRPDAAMVSDLVKSGALKRAALVRVGFDPDEIADEPEPIDPNAKAENAKGEKVAAKEEEPSKKPVRVKNADAPDTEDALSGDIEGYLDQLKESALDVAISRFSGGDADLKDRPTKGLVVRMSGRLHDAAIEGADAAMMKTPKVPESEKAFEDPIRAWTRDHAAEMVGMKWDDGKLIPNPDVKWQISDMARDAINRRVQEAFDNNWTPRELSQALSEDHAFSPARANAIARDQLAGAQEAGSFHYFKAAGVTGKRWLASDACPQCTANASVGVIPMDKPFPSGHMHGPAHPNDRCTIIPEELPSKEASA